MQSSIAYSWARSLAAAFLAGAWELEALVERAGKALGKRRRWIRPLARRAFSALGADGRPRQHRLVRFILEDEGFQRALSAADPDSIEWTHVRFTQIMAPAEAALDWRVPPIVTIGGLAKQLELSPAELDWFADCPSRERQLPLGPLRHYHYRRQPKKFGVDRLIEIPKPRLKALQRKILCEILEPMPPHDAAHGFRPGRSIKTLVAPHLGQRVVLKMDLRDFFPSISRARVLALFLLAGYPESVANLLAGLCTNAVPAEVWDDGPFQPPAPARWHTEELYRRPHLPQGSPTSPALANLCAYRLDCRLTGLAQASHAQYTRYADDLVFSGGRELERSAKRFHIFAASIVLEEGFTPHTRKTRIMRQSVRQRVAGVIVNQHPNLQRCEYDRLKATLHNSLRHGLESQNRQSHANFRAHLAGRISHLSMLNPARGRRLQELLERVP